MRTDRFSSDKIERNAVKKSMSSANFAVLGKSTVNAQRVRALLQEREAHEKVCAE